MPDAEEKILNLARKIEEIMLIRSPEDLERFKEIYEITEEIAKEY